MEAGALSPPLIESLDFFSFFNLDLPSSIFSLSFSFLFLALTPPARSQRTQNKNKFLPTHCFPAILERQTALKRRKVKHSKKRFFLLLFHRGYERTCADRSCGGRKRARERERGRWRKEGPMFSLSMEEKSFFFVFSTSTPFSSPSSSHQNWWPESSR